VNVTRLNSGSEPRPRVSCDDVFSNTRGKYELDASESAPVAFLASTFHGCTESGIFHSLDELIHADPRGIESCSRLPVSKAHRRSLHAREPFQGSLDRDRSSA